MPYAYFNRTEPITPSDTDYLEAAKYTRVENQTPVVADSVTVASDIITKASHGLANGDMVTFTDLGTVTGISLATIYYVVGVAGADFQVSDVFMGDPLALGGLDDTPPTYQKEQDFTTASRIGYIMVGGAGTLIALPSAHMDTDNSTPQPLGAQTYTVSAGQILPGQFKKVFDTGTTATDLVLLWVEGE